MGIDNPRLVLLEGLFFWKDGHLMVEGRVVEDVLHPLIGENVRFAMHQVPLHGIDTAKWGGGCCHWQPADCPVGHQHDPGFLLNISGEGILQMDGERWWLARFDGGRTELPLGLLEGHDGRIACATVLDAEKVREAVSGAGLEAIGVQVRHLRDVVSQFQRAAAEVSEKE